MNDDLGPNKKRLFEVASTAQPGDVLVDLGVREGASSFTMLEATAKQHCPVIGVDPAPCPFQLPDYYYYMQTDSVSAAAEIPGPLFIVFFDTLHIKQQVMAELFHFWTKIRVGGWAVFHDSEWPPGKYDEYINITWPQVIDGINAFFADAGEHVSRTHYPESWGMTFVQKKDDWNPTVEGMDAALNASKMLTERLFR